MTPELPPLEAADAGAAPVPARREDAGPRGSATRNEILNTVDQVPGLTKSQLARWLALPWGTLAHHLARLEADGLVVRRRVQGRRRLYRAGLPDTDLALVSLLRQDLVPAILARLDHDPGLGIGDLSHELDASRKTVRRQLGLLVEAGLVSHTHDYRPRFFVADRTLVRRLRELGETRPGPARPRPGARHGALDNEGPDPRPSSPR